MLLLEQKGRQESQHGILCTVESDSLGERLCHERASRDIQLEALNQSSTPNFLCGGVTVHDKLQLFLKVVPDTYNILEELFLFQDGEIFQSYSAGQRPASESCSVLAWRNSRREFVLCQKCSQGKAGG